MVRDENEAGKSHYNDDADGCEDSVNIKVQECVHALFDKLDFRLWFS